MNKNNTFLTFLKFPQNSIVTLRCSGLLKKKQLCEKQILKTMVKVSVYLLGQSSDVSAMTNFMGTHTSDECFEKVEKGKIMNLWTASLNKFPTLIYQKFENMFMREVLT